MEADVERQLEETNIWIRATVKTAREDWMAMLRWKRELGLP